MLDLPRREGVVPDAQTRDLTAGLLGSDARISNPLLISWKFRDGKLIRLEQLGAGPEFPDALEAAGLSE